jgi:hypothetical protein
VITWAAGNGNENIAFDGYAAYDKVIAIAACNDQGKRSVYSDYGDAVWCCFPSNDYEFPSFNHPRPKTDGIWTTDRQGNTGYNPGGTSVTLSFGDTEGLYTATFGGTSSACPGAAGIAALILSINPSLTWLEVKEILKTSCDRIDPESGNYNAEGRSVFYGFGRLNAKKATALATQSLRLTEPPSLHGSAFFSAYGEVPVKDAKQVGGMKKENKLQGIALSIAPQSPELSIAYHLKMNKLSTVITGKNGEVAMPGDKRRKVTGVAIELTGPQKELYELNYSVRFQSDGKWQNASNGDWCESAKGHAICGLKIELRTKES